MIRPHCLLYCKRSASAVQAEMAERRNGGGAVVLVRIPLRRVSCAMLAHNLAQGREMASLEEVQKANRELAERINDEARNNPASPYAGNMLASQMARLSLS